MSALLSGNQFDQMKNLLESVLCRLYVDILKKVVSEMMVNHLNSSSFLMIILNSTRLVIIFATEIYMKMNAGTVVEMVVQLIMMLSEVALVFDYVKLIEDEVMVLTTHSTMSQELK